MVSQPVRSRRKGMSAVEWIVIAAAILLACILIVAAIGRQTNARLGDTAQDVADPSSLTRRFGN